MADENWQKVREVLDAALQQAPEERQNYVHKACGDDKTLLAEVESLFASMDEFDGFMETPAIAQVADVIESEKKTLESGKCFGHYEVVKQIGIGGMGEVYLAKDKKLGRQVAVKILNDRFRQDKSNLKRFIHEAKAASALNHPNILTIHEIGESEEAHYIVSEYIKGKTLREILNEKALKLLEVLDIAIQIANALTTAHEAHLVHRDIKPENVMIRPDGLVKVLDFGLAKLVEEKNKSFLGLRVSSGKQSHTAEGIILGTVNYMSPEQAKGERVDERTDIFSLGATVYEMIAGQTPFADKSASETFANLIYDEPQPLSRFAANVPDELQQIVSKMLRKNKDERYQTMKDVLTDLKNLKENLSIEERLERSASPNDNEKEVLQATTGGANKSTAETLNSIPQQIKRHKSFAALALVTLTGVVIALGGWFIRDRQETFEAPILSAPFSSEKLSTNGKVIHAVISPDGKNAVYVNKTSNEKQSIWLRNFETSNNVEIVPPSENLYFGLELSPDGNSLYFARRMRFIEGQADIYRTSIFGGIPQKIVGETQGWMSISPDGAKISFVRCYYREEEFCSLWIADSGDGKNEKKLVTRPRPFRIGDNEFSPDGKVIAFAAGQSENASNDYNLMTVDIESSVERELTAEKFFYIKSLVWLPDQKSLLLAASRIPNKNTRIWKVSAVTGKAEPITKDSEMYSSLSLDKTASRLVTTRIKENFRLRVLNLENDSDRYGFVDASSVAFAPDDKIFYSSAMSGNDEIWSVSPDGSQKQLTNNPADDFGPIVTKDNSTVYFGSNRTGAVHIWRMNTDGSNQTQVTHKTGGFPIFVSSDGEWFFFHHGIDRTLWRVSTRSGDEQMVLNKMRNVFALSPDTAFVAFDETIKGEKSIVIVSLAESKTIKSFKFANTDGLLREITWMPDGKGIAYILADKEHRNCVLWLQPLDMEAPRKIADFGKDEIGEGSRLAISLDEKRFAVAQGDWLHDAFLLKGLK